MECTIRIAKTKALISCAVTAQLICVFVFAYAKAGFLITRLIDFCIQIIFMNRTVSFNMSIRKFCYFPFGF